VTDVWREEPVFFQLFSDPKKHFPYGSIIHFSKNFTFSFYLIVSKSFTEINLKFSQPFWGTYFLNNNYNNYTVQFYTDKLLSIYMDIDIRNNDVPVSYISDHLQKLKIWFIKCILARLQFKDNKLTKCLYILCIIIKLMDLYLNCFRMRLYKNWKNLYFIFSEIALYALDVYYTQTYSGGSGYNRIDHDDKQQYQVKIQ
jgi:hypothetical protein